MASCSSELLGAPRDWAIRLTAGVAGGLFFGAIGPFGSFVRPLPLRLASWTCVVCLAVAVLSVSVRGARMLAPRLDLPVWFTSAAAVALACAPVSIVAGLVFNAHYWREGGWAAVLEFYGDCLLIAVPFAAGYAALIRSRVAVSTPLRSASQADARLGADAVPVVSAAAALADRLPPRLGRELVALQMEDHYVRAHTPLGSDLLLMPMGQAVDALADVEGLRVHRSWWVARTAVRGQAWEGRNLRLRLMGGLEAPVARAQVAALRAAGWLEAGPGGDG